MKRIICPIDFSEAGNNAVEYAANWTSQFEAMLILLHVMDDIPGGFAVDRKNQMLPNENAMEAKAKVEQLCEVTEEAFSVSCKAVVVSYTSNVEEAIKRELTEEGGDLVIMGTSGTSDLEELMLGTNTYRAIRSIDANLLLVPLSCSYVSPKRIVYASDYKTEDVDALAKLNPVVDKFNSEITVVHISKNESEKSEEIFSFFKDMYKDKLRNEHVKFERILSSNTASSLDEFMTSNKSDLLVLLTHRYSLLEKIFHDSLTKKMSLVASYPILITKTEELTK